MPLPANANVTGGRLSGEDMRAYMESFADRFLKDRIKYDTEALNICRRNGGGWVVTAKGLNSGTMFELEYDKIVLCTGGCNEPRVPNDLSAEVAKEAGFRGPVIHSSQFASRILSILNAVDPSEGAVIVVGGGKSAQDAASFLAREGRRVRMVFEAADPVVAAPVPLPAFIRKSRFLALISPHVELKTRLERFLHTTWLGSKIVKAIWAFLSWSSFFSLNIPSNSPLRRTHSLFYGVRTNDEGVGRPDGFHALVNQGKIELVAPVRVKGYAPSSGSEGKTVKVVLNDGRELTANAVILATGFMSSWSKIFDDATAEELGLKTYPVKSDAFADEWNYTTLDSSVLTNHERGVARAANIYRGIVPAKNITQRDFAINGAIFTTNNGYAFEVIAHWISSYFLKDPFLHLPLTPQAAIQEAERNNAWLGKRYPNMLNEINESYSSDLAFWSWPQVVSTLLEDMSLPSWRSGGNWFTWPFKPIDLEEIACLKQERDQKRVECMQKN
ncbi:unnamed protein product [Somion occarium]